MVEVAFFVHSGQIFLHTTEDPPMRPALTILLALGAAGCVTGPAAAPVGKASAAWVEGVKYTSMGQGTGAFSATLDGSTNRAAPYAIRVHITKGGKIAPHTH